MSDIKILQTQQHHVDGIALVDAEGAVWRTFSRPWWDIASWLWWALMPGQRALVQLRCATGLVRVRAVRISGTCVRIGSPP